MRILLIFKGRERIGQCFDGVDTICRTLVRGLGALGHQVELVAPAGSEPLGVPMHLCRGTLQPSTHDAPRTDPQFAGSDSLLARMWAMARDLAPRFDVLLNLAYDWLPLYLGPFMGTPVAHLLTLSSSSDALDEAIVAAVKHNQNAVAAHSRAQAVTFPGGSAFRIVSAGIDSSLYEFSDTGDGSLAWMGRISPEKGLQDALAAAKISRRKIRILGKVQDAAYFDQCLRTAAGVDYEYMGFLPIAEAQRILRRASCLLFTSYGVEALGLVVLDALACGVPTVSYRCGGPSEVLTPATGIIVERDAGPTALAAAIPRAATLSRQACRQLVDSTYTLEAFARRVSDWLAAVRAPVEP